MEATSRSWKPIDGSGFNRQSPSSPLFLLHVLLFLSSSVSLLYFSLYFFLSPFLSKYSGSLLSNVRRQSIVLHLLQLLKEMERGKETGEPNRNVKKALSFFLSLLPLLSFPRSVRKILRGPGAKISLVRKL